jgi:glycine amidinotransferase
LVTALSAVNCHTEWDPLKTVIVGTVKGAQIPDEVPAMIRATVPKKHWSFFLQNNGHPFPEALIEKATQELDALVDILRSEGVEVLRPNPGDMFEKSIETEFWSTKNGFYAAMPRDNLLAIDDEVIQAPMAWRSRYRESEAYHEVLEELVRRGGKRTRAPRPQLKDSFYRSSPLPDDGEFHSVISEDEPTFDAADFLKFGKDLVCQQSHVTNLAGIEWLRKHLEGRYKIHRFTFRDDKPMHIDATIMPLKPGLLLFNPLRVPPELADDLKNGLFKGWDLVKAPMPVIPDHHPLYMTSKWLNVNILSIDTERVIVESQDEPMFRLMTDLGMKPIRCSFRNFNTFGGSFHCATCDVFREGTAGKVLND